MPSGFYIYNNDTYTTAFDITDDTEYFLLDWNYLSRHKAVSKKELIEYNENLQNAILFRIYTKDGYATRIEERYIP